MTDELKNGVYLINGTRKLYYQNGLWHKAVYAYGRYTGNISPLDTQPKKIKSCVKITTWLD